MRQLALPSSVLVILLLGLLIFAGSSGAYLPERVATHFNAAGQPNGWMTRSGYIQFLVLFGIGLPGFTIAMFALTSLLPDWMINLPRKAYWLSPEMRPLTTRYVLAQGLWLACLETGLLISLHALTILANRQSPPQLSTTWITVQMATFLLLMAVWSIRFIRHFRNA